MPKPSTPTPAHERLWKTPVKQIPADPFTVSRKDSAALAALVEAANTVLGALTPRRRIGGFLRYERCGGHGPVAVYLVDILL